MTEPNRVVPRVEPPRVRVDGPAVLVGGAAFDAHAYALAAARGAADIAADGGANAFRPGAAPRLRAIVGDFDSIAHPEAWAADPGVRLVRLEEQDSTDLEKCLYTVEAPLYLGVGFLGARFDHTLAATHVLLRYAHRRVILIGESDLIFLAPRVWRARLAEGARVSLFPLRPVRALGSDGLVWPLDGLTLAAGARVGTSNRAASAEIETRFADLGAAVILSRDWLDAAIDSLTTAPEDAWRDSDADAATETGRARA